MQPIDLVKSHAAGGRIPRARYAAMYAIATVFTAICAVTVWSFRTSCWLLNPTDLNARVAYVDALQLSGNPAPKLVIMGSSRPAFGIDTHALGEQLGIKPLETRNIAFPGFGPDQLGQQVDTRRAQLTSSAVIWIVGIDDYFFLTRQESARERDSLLERTENWLAESIPGILEFNKKGRELLRNISESLEWARPRSISNWTIDSRGSWSEPQLTNRVVDPIKEEHVFKAILDVYFDQSPSLSSAEIDKFVKMLNTALNKNIRVVLVSMPYHPKYESLGTARYGRFTTAAIEEVTRISNERGIEFVNCRASPTNCDVQLNGFADPVHLNQSGAAAFTKYLAKRLTN